MLKIHSKHIFMVRVRQLDYNVALQGASLYDTSKYIKNDSCHGN